MATFAASIQQKQTCRRLKGVVQAHSLKVDALSWSEPEVKLLYGSGRKRTSDKSGRVNFLLRHRDGEIWVKRKKVHNCLQRSKVGRQGGLCVWFLFQCPSRAYHCVSTAGAIQGSALGHVSHLEPQLCISDSCGQVISTRERFDLFVPRTPQTEQPL